MLWLLMMITHINHFKSHCLDVEDGLASCSVDLLSLFIIILSTFEISLKPVMSYFNLNLLTLTTFYYNLSLCPYFIFMRLILSLWDLSVGSRPHSLSTKYYFGYWIFVKSNCAFLGYLCCSDHLNAVVIVFVLHVSKPVH